MKVSDVLIKCGLAIYAISIFVNFTIYKIPKIPMIIILCVASVLILMGCVFLRIGK
ncbi:hypothetical protein Thexy_2369 [Thermoanaerobacterium xylanolyticum LX-11]|uniref:Uncharacterized protein n=1 Tax=Thermoanaerobacterium xylanolyticum (strain ATCC 49914 / DSM 7097 / LX-11) TaxID=858215 RepID=F6BFR1_THEXL|nr:hypothetical protein Thexy_2369 [Thermoanaerobacterium xylanolyticum LX-11]